MKFDYLFDESEKSLSPFLSPILLSAVLNGVMIAGACCILFWPFKDMAVYIGRNREPLLFAGLSAAVLFIHSYIGLCCGRGEFFKSRHPPGFEKEVAVLEKERHFFQYALIEFVLHTFILLLPFLPLLILSASISRVPSALFGKAVLVVLTASLLCRMAGFMLYLFWGRLSSAGFWIARIFMIFFMLGTMVFAPAANPVRILFELDRNPAGISPLFPDAYVFYLIGVSGAILIFAAVNHGLVKRYISTQNRLSHPTKY